MISLYYPYNIGSKTFVEDDFLKVVKRAYDYNDVFYLLRNQKKYYSGMELEYLNNIQKKGEN